MNDLYQKIMEGIQKQVDNSYGINERNEPPMMPQDKKALSQLKSKKTKLVKQLKRTGKRLSDGNYSDDIAVLKKINAVDIELSKLHMRNANNPEDKKAYADQIKKLQSKKYESLDEKLSDVPASLRKEAHTAKITLDNLLKRATSIAAAITREEDKQKVKELDDMRNQVLKDATKQEKVYKKLKSQIAKLAKK